MITYLKYAKICYKKRMTANCSPCSSCRRQDLACSCGEKLHNTKPVSQAAGYLQVLHVMVTQDGMAVSETNPCGDKQCVWFSLKAEQPRWPHVRTCPASCSATETRHKSELSIKETEYYDANAICLKMLARKDGACRTRDESLKSI